MKKYFTLILNIVALSATIPLAITHYSYEGWYSPLIAFLVVVAGYLFGRWTCHIHNRQTAFLLTFIIFVLLNFLHSLLDGVSIGAVDSFLKVLALSPHELGRQLPLYVTFLGMLSPFIGTKKYRIIAVVMMSVTGVWVIGTYMGYQLLGHLKTSRFEIIADQATFLFLGDIIHHLYEGFVALKKKRVCCHQHI